MNELYYEIGSTNVYADLEQRNANVLLSKADLVRKVNALLKHQGFGSSQAASYLGISEPDLSSFLRGHFDRVSEQKLRDYMAKLKQADRRGGHGHDQ